MAEMLAYLNGRLVPASQARLAVSDLGFVMGATISEQTRTFGKRLYRLSDHIDRLFNSLAIAGIEIELPKEKLASVSEELVAHNAQSLSPWDDLGLIHFVTAGENAVYGGGQARSEPTVCAHTYPLPFHLWADKLRNGVRLITPSIRQLPPECYSPQLKCRSRMHYYLAEKEVHAQDPDAIALLLDSQGRVTETSTANFLMVEAGSIVTPPIAYTFSGISRSTLRRLGDSLNLASRERNITLSEISRASEALLSSTGFCLLPATRINGAQVGDGRPGPVFQKLLQAWSQEAGLDIEAQITKAAAART
jgi:branched-subunit amino acid aminotransferase/4-amino-4-deoxychorismate lyase